MMTSGTLKTLGLILQSFQGSGANRLHPSVDFFKTEAESRLTLSQSLQLNLRLGGYSIWSAILQSHFHINLDFKKNELDHLPASWQFKYY
jgi:hypothetical protein